MITRPYNPIATGYDDGVKYSTAYSLCTYSSTGRLSSPLNIDATPFYDTLAYFVFVRGIEA